MKPLSEINDEAAMILRGRRSTLASARNEAEAALRDAYTQLSGCEWKDLPVRVAAVQAWANRLNDIYEWWEHVNAPTTTKAPRTAAVGARPERNANASLIVKAPDMAAALDYIVRRLQVDVDDGSRPDQWTMEDLIRTAKAALPDGWVLGAA